MWGVNRFLKYLPPYPISQNQQPTILMYNYQLFHLKVSSIFPILGMEESTFSDAPDVVVRTGKVTPPAEDLPDTFYKPASAANQDLYYLEIADIARYQINGKSEVLIDIAEGSTEKDAMAFFFDTILTVLLLKHHQFVFHASAVKGKDGAILICAPAGGGKSTLATVLLNRGFELIEDDRCLLHWDEEQQALMIRNYLPFLDLWKDLSKAAEKSGQLTELYQIRDNIQKFRYDAHAITVKEAVKVQKIFLISMDNLEDHIEQKDIKGIAKARTAINYTHLNHLISFVSNSAAHFQYLAKTITNVPVIRVSRSRLTSLKDFSAHIMQEIGMEVAEMEKEKV